MWEIKASSTRQMMERCKSWQYLLIATRNVNANMRNRDARFADFGEISLKIYECAYTSLNLFAQSNLTEPEMSPYF